MTLRKHYHHSSVHTQTWTLLLKFILIPKAEENDKKNPYLGVFDIPWVLYRLIKDPKHISFPKQEKAVINFIK